ncbi:MAG: DUF3322 domain-containing protein, partial [Micrococcales bacterium]|nr:DUF3322 domain-containing protein [Micrococcales bacterium]
MTGRLLGPADAVAALGAQVAAKWASAVCAELGIGDTVAWRVPLRPGVAGGADVERLGYGVWADWDAAWQRCARTLPAGLAVARRPVTIRGLTGRYPATLVAADLDAAARAGRAAVPAGRGTADDEAGVDLVRVRALAMSLATAGARLDPALLRAMSRLAPADADTLLAVVAWLGDHPDVGDWTARQLPVPGRHTKWLERHGALLQRATGRDVRA